MDDDDDDDGDNPNFIIFSKKRVINKQSYVKKTRYFLSFKMQIIIKTISIIS